MKTKTLLIAAVMMLGMTALAFGQGATFSVGSNPITAVIATGQTERAGGLTFNLVGGSGSTPGTAGNPTTITITYGGAPITSNIGATVISDTLLNCTDVTHVGVNTTASSNSGGILVLNVSSGCNAGGFTVGANPNNVRVAVAGLNFTSLNATLNASAINFTANQTTVTVISNILPGIASIKLQSSTPVVAIPTATGIQPAVNTTNLQIKEGFLNAWDQAATNPVGLRITLNALPPAGVTFRFPAMASTDGSGAPAFETMNSDTTIINANVDIKSSSTSPVVFYKAVSGTDATKQETLTITVTVLTDTTKTVLPLSPATFTAVVSMAPIGTALTSSGGFDNSQPVPRYAASDVGPATFAQISASQTVLLFPFVQSVGSLGFNTGLSISNTTEDPGTSALGFPGAVAQGGSVTFYFFPSLPASGTNPTNFSYTTTAGSPGSGLDSTGKLISGSTYTVLVTQILAAAGQPTDFNGYLIVITNFTNGHGLGVVSDFTKFSQGYLALVMIGDRTVNESLNN